MRSTQQANDYGTNFIIEITLARTSGKPPSPGNPMAAEPHPSHPLWVLNAIKDSDQLANLAWRLRGVQEDGSVLVLPPPNVLSGHGTHTLIAQSKAHRKAGRYVSFELRDANGAVQFQHPVNPPVAVGAGKTLTVTFVAELVERVIASAPGVGATATVDSGPPKLVETE